MAVNAYPTIKLSNATIVMRDLEDRSFIEIHEEDGCIYGLYDKGRLVVLFEPRKEEKERDEYVWLSVALKRFLKS